MAKSAYFGFNPPFYKDGKVLQPQSDIRLIKNDLLQLLLTIPGERRMRPNFGTKLRNFVFEPGDQTSLDSLIAEIRQKIEIFEPRVSVSSLTFQFDSDNNTLRLNLAASVTLSRENLDEFALEVDVPVRIVI